MLRNYFKLALKVLGRNKFFTGISLFGISFTLENEHILVGSLPGGNNAQLAGVEIGDTYPIFLKYDELTDRLFGSMKIRKHLIEAPESITNERVTFMVTEHHELGWRGIVNQRYSGMLYRSDCRIPVKLGQYITCYAKLVRPDGKIDLQMSAGTVDKYDEAVSMVWEYLMEHKFLFLTDKSDAADIYNQFQLSKKTFKQAVGRLYKDRKIKLFEDKIARIDE